MIYVYEFVEWVEKENIEFGVVFDGDGDWNMIYGKGVFVIFFDSVVIIVDWVEKVIFYFKSGIKGFVRFMFISGVIDIVVKERGFEVFEVFIGWKFFGNLMDVGWFFICGEEFFGIGLDYIWEKDGVWVIVGEFCFLFYFCGIINKKCSLVCYFCCCE